MSIEINTPTLKKLVGKRVLYKLVGSSMWSSGTIVEIINRNIIFDTDTRHFSDIKEIQLVENE